MAPGRDQVNNRGQTGVDFIVGIGVLLLTVAFVVSFVPGLFAPFDGDATTAPLVAERVADELVYTALAGGQSPAELDTAETVAFFAAAASPGDSLGMPATLELNVTLEKAVGDDLGRQIVCSDGSTISQTCSPGDDRLTLGNPVPTSGTSVATALRVVSIDGGDYVLVVRVW